jgi:hypothetical protein
MLITWCHVEWYVYVSLVSIKCFRRSCMLRKVWYDTNAKQHMKAKDRATRTPLKTGGHLGCFGWASSSCSISSTRRVTLVTNSCPSIINASPLLFPVQPFTSIFYYLSVCSRRDYSYITAHVPLIINKCI